jgi:HK97 family phage major capsid protein
MNNMKLFDLKRQYAALCDEQAAAVQDEAEYNRIQGEIDKLAGVISRTEAVEARNRELEQPETEPYRPVAENKAPGQDDGGFESFGEFLNSVRFKPGDSRLRNFATGDAGILIPPAFAQNILSLNKEEEIVMPRANVIPAGDPPDGEFSIPYLQQGANGVMGGVSLTWTAEEQEKPDTGEPEIKPLTLKPQEISGVMTVTNKTLMNWKAAGAFMQANMRQAWISGRDYKFLRGAGVGCPLGVLSAPGAITVARKTASTIVYEDIAKMRGRLLPEAVQGAVWVANVSALPTLMQLEDGSKRLIFMPGNVTLGIPDTLLGIPVLWTGKQPVLGTKGDLVLVNFKYYLVKEGSGPFVALSEHVEFKTNKTVFRIVANIDGQPWVKEPLLLEDGATTVSPYVILK